ncbi:hypothetical protein JG687_00010140 [Phytophthora cactorum]|uniref:Uncharacterized protein n=1 Tax=Phytophthora cactorum TaxID=29920 RepID=A0A8T1UAB2_9STRA|nr:hypothetical protein JG687_00010140 [Phytophthora cactorum]
MLFYDKQHQNGSSASNQLKDLQTDDDNAYDRDIPVSLMLERHMLHGIKYFQEEIKTGQASDRILMEASAAIANLSTTKVFRVAMVRLGVISTLLDVLSRVKTKEQNTTRSRAKNQSDEEDNASISHFYSIEKMSASCFHATQNKNKTWLFLPGSDERSKTSKGVGKSSITGVDRPSRRVDVLDLERCFDTAIQFASKNKHMDVACEEKLSMLDQDFMAIYARMTQRYSSTTSSNDSRKMLTKLLFEQKWSDVVMGELESMLMVSFLEQGVVLRKARILYAKTFFQLENLYKSQWQDLIQEQEEVEYLREEVRQTNELHKQDAQNMKERYETEIDKLKTTFESDKSEMERRLADSKEQMTKMGDTMKTLNAIFRQMREDTEKVKAVELRENYGRLEHKYEQCREEIEQLRPVVQEKQQLQSRIDELIRDRDVLKDQITELHNLVDTKDTVIASLMEQQSNLIAAQDLKAAREEEMRRQAEEEKEYERDDALTLTGTSNGPASGVCVRFPKTIWISPYHASLATSVILSKATETEREALDKKILEYVVTNVPEDERPENFLEPKTTIEPDEEQTKKRRGKINDETIDGNLQEPLHFVDANLWVELMMLEYKEEQAHRRAAIRLMFQTATSAAAEASGSVAEMSLSAMLGINYASMDMEQFRAMVHTLNDEIPSFMVATLFRNAYSRGNGTVNFDSFMDAAETSQFFSTCMRLESPSSVVSRILGHPFSRSPVLMTPSSRAAFIVGKFFAILGNEIGSTIEELPLWTRSMTDSLAYEISSTLLEGSYSDGARLLTLFQRLIDNLGVAKLIRRETTGCLFSSSDLCNIEKALNGLLDFARQREKSSVELLIDASMQSTHICAVLGELSGISGAFHAGRSSPLQLTVSSSLNGGIGPTPKPVFVELIYDFFLEKLGARCEAERLIHDVFANCRLLGQNEALAFLHAIFRCGLHSFRLVTPSSELPSEVSQEDPDSAPVGDKADFVAIDVVENILQTAFSKLSSDQKTRLKLRITDAATDKNPSEVEANAFLVLALHEWRRYILYRLNEIRVACCAVEAELTHFEDLLQLEMVATILQKTDITFTPEDLCVILRRLYITEKAPTKSSDTDSGDTATLTLKPDPMSERIAAACFPLVAKETMNGLQRLAPRRFEIKPGPLQSYEFLVRSLKPDESAFTGQPCNLSNPNQLFIYNSKTHQFHSAKKKGLCLHDGGGWVGLAWGYCLDDGGGDTAGASKYTIRLCSTKSENQHFEVLSQATLTAEQQKVLDAVSNGPSFCYGSPTLATDSVMTDEYDVLVRWMYEHCAAESTEIALSLLPPLPKRDVNSDDAAPLVDDSPTDVTRHYMTKMDFYYQIKNHFTQTIEKLDGDVAGTHLRSEEKNEQQKKTVDCIEKAVARFGYRENAATETTPQLKTAISWVDSCIKS